MADVTIGFCGSIGAGKTTLINDLVSNSYRIKQALSHLPHNHRQVTGKKESFDPELNGQAYNGETSAAFKAQMHYLAVKRRLDQVVRKTPGAVFIDRPVGEDYHVFGEAQISLGKLSLPEISRYRAEFSGLEIPEPDLYIYLRARVDTLQKRIRFRGRPEEQVISPAYLALLNELYPIFFGKVTKPVITIDTDDITLGKTSDQRLVETTIDAIIQEIERSKPSSSSVSSSL